MPLIIIRKPGKLPFQTFKVYHQLEYGESSLEIHTDSLSSDDNVLLIDDLLATGGTLAAATKLIEKAGGQVSGISVLIELQELEGRKSLSNYEINSIITY